MSKKFNKKIVIFLIVVCAILLFLLIFVGIYSAVPKSKKIIADALNSELNYLTIVNDDNPYDFGGKYDTALKQSLVYPPDVYGEATPVEKATYTAFLELQRHLANQGMLIGLYSAYRTQEDQQWVYDTYANLEGWSETNRVLEPGYSEHHTGLVINVVIWYQGENDDKPIWYTETAEHQKTIPFFKLLHENLADYGFIDRYPSGKEAITGIPSEPYEIRFVGSAKIAHKIMDNNLTLEEYLDKH